MIKKISVKSHSYRQLIDITGEVDKIIKESQTADSVTVFAKHTTCLIIITETADSFEQDLIKYIDDEASSGPFSHTHDPDPSHVMAHLMSALHGPARTVPIENGKLLLGTWQRICLLELDGPKSREIIVQTL